MTERPNPVFRTMEEESLVGTMAIYHSDAEAYQGIPRQWSLFLRENPALKGSSTLYGASPCSDDRKIHYLTGVAQGGLEGVADGESLILAAGEYVVVRVEDTALLRDTWTWLIGPWLANSGRREKNAPEFERFTSISEAGTPIGPVELWVALEPLATD